MLSRKTSDKKGNRFVSNTILNESRKIYKELSAKATASCDKM